MFIKYRSSLYLIIDIIDNISNNLSINLYIYIEVNYNLSIFPGDI